VYHLFEIKHYPLITPAMAKRLHRADERLFQAECLGKALKPRDPKMQRDDSPSESSRTAKTN
jgi:hypothetical protein